MWKVNIAGNQKLPKEKLQVIPVSAKVKVYNLI